MPLPERRLHALLWMAFLATIVLAAMGQVGYAVGAFAVLILLAASDFNSVPESHSARTERLAIEY